MLVSWCFDYCSYVKCWIWYLDVKMDVEIWLVLQKHSLGDEITLSYIACQGVSSNGEYELLAENNQIPQPTWLSSLTNSRGTWLGIGLIEQYIRIWLKELDSSVKRYFQIGSLRRPTRGTPWPSAKCWIWYLCLVSFRNKYWKKNMIFLKV